MCISLLSLLLLTFDSCTPQVEELLRLLANVFTLRVEGKSGVQKVFPYHKSVSDWLLDAGNSWRVDTDSAHTLMGVACFDSITETSQQAVAEACRDGSFKGRGIIMSNSKKSCNYDALLSYSLRYSVAHLCTANQTSRLEQLVLDFACFWPSVYAAGK